MAKTARQIALDIFPGGHSDTSSLEDDIEDAEKAAAAKARKDVVRALRNYLDDFEDYY